MDSTDVPATTLLYLFAELWAPASDGRAAASSPSAPVSRYLDELATALGK